MNDTKWDELRLAMHAMGEKCPKYRTRCIDNGYVSPWDREWYHHFRECGYSVIEWVEIRPASPEHRAEILKRLRSVHVPGIETEEGFTVFGWIRPGEAVEYL